jgi:hypothetical protein
MRRPRTVRDAAIAAGAAVASLGFVVSGAAVLVDMIEVIRIGYAPTTYDIGKGLDVGHDLVLAGAFGLVSFAVVANVDRRERRLAFAAVVAAVAFAAWIAAQALYGVSEPRGLDQLVVSDVLGALAASALVAGAIVAAVAFRGAESAPPEDQAQRDGLLAWAAGALGLSLAFSTASAIVFNSSLFPGRPGASTFISGLAIGIGGAALAAVAFLVSQRKQRRAADRWMHWRELLIAVAMAIFVVGFVFTAVGDGMTANASAHDDFTHQLFTTSHWLEAASGWILSACAALAAVGFLVSSASRPIPVDAEVAGP